MLIRPGFVVLAGLLLTSIFSSSSAQAQQIEVSAAINVDVFDAFTGDPITGAPVLVVGESLMGVTDIDGQVRLVVQVPAGGEIKKIFTTPSGYAPGAGEVFVGSGENHLSIGVVPEQRFSTDVMDPAVGGSFTFQDVVEGQPQRLFHLELDVPPGALPQVSKITLSYLPTPAMSLIGIADDAMFLGLLQLQLRDPSGQVIPASFNAPVTIRLRPYTVDSFGGLDTASLDVVRYNTQTHQFDAVGQPTAVDEQSFLVEFTRQSFSMIGVVAPFDEAGDLAVDTVSQCCTTECISSVVCGWVIDSCTTEVSKGTEVTVSAGFKANLEREAAGSVEGVVASIETRLKIRLEVSAGAEATAVTAKKSSKTIPSGATTPNLACYSGEMETKVRYEEYEIKVGGVSIGTVDVPILVGVAWNLQFNELCAGCAEMGPKPNETTDTCGAGPCN